jgi:hypothetical protein
VPSASALRQLGQAPRTGSCNEPRHLRAEGVLPRRLWVRFVATDVEIAVALIGCSADSTNWAGSTSPWKINLKRLLRTEPVCVVAITVAAVPLTRYKITAVVLKLRSSTDVGLLVSVTVSAVYATRVACLLRLTV